MLLNLWNLTAEIKISAIRSLSMFNSTRVNFGKGPKDIHKSRQSTTEIRRHYQIGLVYITNMKILEHRVNAN